jgi:hypothetical protein
MPQGALSHIGIGKETTFGTAVAASDYLRFISESLTEEIEQVISAAMGGIFDEGASYEGAHTIAGDLVYEAYPNGLGHLLRAAVGAPVTTQPDASGSPTVYQHVFTPIQTNFSSASALPPYSLEIDRNFSQAFQYAGCLVNDLTVSFGTDTKIMQATAAIIAKKLSMITATSPTLETTSPFLWNQAAISINSGANTDVQTLDFGVNNSLEGRATIDGTKEVSRILRNGKRSFPVNFTFDLQDLTEFNRFRNQTEISASIVLTGALISGSQNFKLLIEIPKLRYTAFPINVGGAETITAQVTGQAKYDATSAYAMRVTLTNTKASY